MDIQKILEQAVASKASDIFLIAGLYRLYKDGIITKETALNYAVNPEMLQKKL